MNLKEFYKGRKVLITGHTGFKGSWLCSILLEFESEICGIALDPQTNPNLFNQLNLRERINSHNIIDVRNFDALKLIFESFQPEIVFHLAAQPLVIDSYKNPVYTYDVNVMGTVNICECVRLTKSVKSFVNITTDKVYENIEEENHAYIETDRLNGFDPYSNSKSCSELVTDSYKKSFFNDLEIAVSTCRAGNVIGGGDYSENRIIPDCVRAARENESIIIRNPNSIRPYQHVLEPLVFYLYLAYRQLLNMNLAGNYNIGPSDRDCINTLQLAELFYGLWGNLGNNIILEKSKCADVHEAKFLKLNSMKCKVNFDWGPQMNITTAIKWVVDWEKYENKNIITTIQINDYLEKFKLK